jgi:hypothetical protein
MLVDRMLISRFDALAIERVGASQVIEDEEIEVEGGSAGINKLFD